MKESAIVIFFVSSSSLIQHSSCFPLHFGISPSSSFSPRASAHTSSFQSQIARRILPQLKLATSKTPQGWQTAEQSSTTVTTGYYRFASLSTSWDDGARMLPGFPASVKALVRSVLWSSLILPHAVNPLQPLDPSGPEIFCFITRQNKFAVCTRDYSIWKRNARNKCPKAAGHCLKRSVHPQWLSISFRSLCSILPLWRTPISMDKIGSPTNNKTHGKQQQNETMCCCNELNHEISYTWCLWQDHNCRYSPTKGPIGTRWAQEHQQSRLPRLFQLANVCVYIVLHNYV